MTEPAADAVSPSAALDGSDLSHIGTNREADPALVEVEQDWTQVHPDVPAHVMAMVTAHAVNAETITP